MLNPSSQLSSPNSMWLGLLSHAVDANCCVLLGHHVVSLGCKGVLPLQAQ